ncbi:MAG: 3-methyl-2-oxobutanoate hydroxymethyltransferase, partial [Sphingobacteriales bacterium]|nr:3-methyl-2-oxobutanoate hydroxymethyltransferase [Sphingobacteriales bacterium]
MGKKLTISSIQKQKGVKPLVMITAYDALFAKLFEESADMILVGDSLNMSFAGKTDTISATLDQMIYHTNAVCSGAKKSFVVCDMPFGTYLTKEEAVKNAIKVFQETAADCVKIEGGADKAEIIRHLTSNGIAVCGHIGLLPQSVRSEGGYKVKGKTQAEREQLLKDAKAVEDAGAFCMVIEGTKADVAKEIAESVSIPVIGIGAGADVDGQVLVFSDMLGFFEEFTPKFVKKYLDGSTLVKNA